MRVIARSVSDEAIRRSPYGLWFASLVMTADRKEQELT